MPKAPQDYQTRYPIDFGDIDPSTPHRVVQLYAQDLGKSRGILWLPPKGKPKTVIIMSHPRADFGHHYSIPFWVDAGYAAFGFNTRYLNNDAMMLHESLMLDMAAGIKYLREEEGFEQIVMLGNSGGGSLFSYYDSQARTPKGKRVASPPGGGPPDLNQFDLPTADGFIVLAAHPGQGMVLMSCLDAAVVDESDPLASDSSLDMYHERNGFRTPPAPSHYSEDFLTRYRAAQRARCSRIDAIARRHIAEAAEGRTAMREKGFASTSADHRNFVARRAMAPRYMVVYRTQANPNYCDLSIDPSERTVGSIISPRPDLANYSPFGLGRIVTPDAWLSTWSGLSSYAKTGANLPKVTVPTLVVGANADQDIFLSDVRAEYEASGASDKTITFIEGAEHFMRAGGTKAHEDPRPRLMKVLVDWTRERFPAAPARPASTSPRKPAARKSAARTRRRS
ncbi:MAG: alpha/beta hydrolase [Candidatus Binataceae bacterium]